MSGHKGISKKQALTIEDLAELVEIHRRLQRMHGALNHASVQQLPLMAASATVKAAWAELSGAGWAWAYPSSAMPLDGVPAEAKARERREPGPMRHGDRPDDGGGAPIASPETERAPGGLGPETPR